MVMLLDLLSLTCVPSIPSIRTILNTIMAEAKPGLHDLGLLAQERAQQCARARFLAPFQRRDAQSKSTNVVTNTLSR